MMLEASTKICFKTIPKKFLLKTRKLNLISKNNFWRPNWNNLNLKAKMTLINPNQRTSKPIKKSKLNLQTKIKVRVRITLLRIQGIKKLWKKTLKWMRKRNLWTRKIILVILLLNIDILISLLKSMHKLSKMTNKMRVISMPKKDSSKKKKKIILKWKRLFKKAILMHMKRFQTNG